MAGSLKFGRGSRLQLAEQLEQRKLSRPLIVSDSVVLNLDSIQDVLGQLEQRCQRLKIFDGGQAEPAVPIAEAAAVAGSSFSPDCVIGIGGGSNLDVAKIAAAVARHGGTPRDYFGFNRVPGAILPLFALPTTAGTGSEVSHSAVLTDLEQQVKVSSLSPWLRPTCAIVDPVCSASCPARITAHSGIDALVHAIEAYTNRDYSEMVDVDPQARAYEGSFPLTRLLAGEAIMRIGRSLVTAVEHPDDAAARDDMALAATLAGMAFSNSGVGIVHALEYPIGALTHCTHGEGNGLLLPHVMRYNLPVRQSEFARIADWLGADVRGAAEEDAASMAIDRVVELQNAIGIQTRLSDLGLQHSDIPAVAAKAFGIKRLMDVNPQTPREQDLESILEQAY